MTRRTARARLCRRSRGAQTDLLAELDLRIPMHVRAGFCLPPLTAEGCDLEAPWRGSARIIDGWEGLLRLQGWDAGVTA